MSNVSLKNIRNNIGALKTALSLAVEQANKAIIAQNLSDDAADNYMKTNVFNQFNAGEFKTFLETIPGDCNELIKELQDYQEFCKTLINKSFNVPAPYTVQAGSGVYTTLEPEDITTPDDVNLDEASKLIEQHYNVTIPDKHDVFESIDSNLAGFCKSTTIRNKKTLLDLYKRGLMNPGQPYDWLMPAVSPRKVLGSQTKMTWRDENGNILLLGLDIQTKRTKSSCKVDVQTAEDILNKFDSVVKNIKVASPEEIVTAVALVNSISTILLKESGITEAMVQKALDDIGQRYPGGLTIETSVGKQEVKVVKEASTIDGPVLTNEELVKKYPDLIKDKVIGVTTQYRFTSDAANSTSSALAEAVANGDIVIEKSPSHVVTKFKENKEEKETK